ncbi:SigB/SigF/SigG family RNA polymerase sigma factor [Streptomyces beihaiensis]|uniref:SigB/SigF/SigG family RNA polymerase sigma factor n=1 Tax=Streptomyces beihaiensis TaxID=2984495 RepID=A0ABT3TTW9_9ACTN|nr:SigB/SigF/SigG family RNA polymerase sigma factor [Streptomyces beihaiensis]MCX3059530.1 SigB/SigF/SigG family RNA polymerase sigma factor [Streptomyces beihaiensis]
MRTNRRPSKEPGHSRSPREHTRRHEDTPDTTAAFHRLASLPDGPERDLVREEIIREWIPVAERVAHRFRHRGEPNDDLRQVAALGLVKAVDRYEPDRGHAFASFAIPTITGELKRHFRDHLCILHMPRRLQELHSRTYLATVDLGETRPGRAATAREIADVTGLSEREAATGMAAHEAYRTASLDAPIRGTDVFHLADVVGDEDQELGLVVDREALKPLLADLPEIKQRILYLRFFRDLTQSQIAGLIGVSQMQVSRILRATFAHLREGLLAEA